MKFFRVHGVDRESGRERRQLIEAETEDAAIDRAGELGIVVERVEVDPDYPPKRTQTRSTGKDPAVDPVGSWWIGPMQAIARTIGWLLVIFGFLSMLGGAAGRFPDSTAIGSAANSLSWANKWLCTTVGAIFVACSYIAEVSIQVRALRREIRSSRKSD